MDIRQNDFTKPFIHSAETKPSFKVNFSRNQWYELRNPYYKGCLGEKDMSLIHSQQVGGQDRCCIFEGFMDFLSYKTLEKRGDNVRNMTAVTLGTMYSGSFGSSSYWDLVCLLGL